MFWGEQTCIRASDTGCGDEEMLEGCGGGGVTLFYREGAQDWEGLVAGNGCPRGKKLRLGVGALEGVVSSALDPSEGEEQSQSPSPLAHSPLPLLPPPQ